MPTSMPTSAPTAFISFLFPNEASDWIVNSTYFIELRVGSSASTRVRLELFASLDLIDPLFFKFQKKQLIRYTNGKYQRIIWSSMRCLMKLKISS
jgi:hypothetical protein